jgi:hypothetical protein
MPPILPTHALASSDTSIGALHAKRLHEPYLPRESAWVKVKNRAYWRWELEREGALRSRGATRHHLAVSASGYRLGDPGQRRPHTAEKGESRFSAGSISGANP